jgi:oligoendopeptidase F
MAGNADARDRYLTLLGSGGNDYPMEQLKKAGVDLSQPDTVRAVIEQLDDLVTRLEKELASRT